MKSHCINGHKFTDKNTRFEAREKQDGSPRLVRVCRMCSYLSNLRHQPLKNGVRNPLVCSRGHPWVLGSYSVERRPKGKTAKVCIECRRIRVRQNRKPTVKIVKTHCKHGHDLLIQNSFFMARRPGGKKVKVCKACHYPVAALWKRRNRLKLKRERQST